MDNFNTIDCSDLEVIGKGVTATVYKLDDTKIIKAYKKGDEIIITGPTTGVIETTIEELHVDDSIVEQCERGQLFSIKVPCKVRPSDRLYKMVDSSEIIDTQQ